MPFTHHYNNWRQTRINKVRQILGADFAKGKTILELACGHGHTGLQLAGEGATVTFAEGRPEHIEALLAKAPDADVIQLDQDKSWDLGRKFDLVIHWGVLYHLDNWKEDLRCTLNHSDLVCMETEVADSSDPKFEIKQSEEGTDQALNGTGSHPSPAMIEEYLTSLGATFVRYDDSDINSLFHHYDWPVRETKQWKPGQRRFWMIRK